MNLSVGIGLTNDCNLACAHCYRDTDRVDNISLDQVKTICDNLPVGSMGFGTGENILNPAFVPIVEYLYGRAIKLNLASNGHSLTTLDDEHLRMFHDVDVSIDFPTPGAQDRFRGEGNWALVHRAIERCHSLGVPISILTTLMCTNFDRMDAMVDLARRDRATLRVNAYQSVKTDAFKLSYAQFWTAYRAMFAAGLVISCAEPVVRAAMGLAEVHSPCGHTSIRFNPRGQIIPCVYWPMRDGAIATIDDLPRLGIEVMNSEQFEQARAASPTAADCPCQGGCTTRRALNGNLDAHDEYCPWARGEELRLRWQAAPAVDLMRSRNVCTTIVT